MTSLTTWENFYVIVGSSAGALTGLMFVVITLISGAPRRNAGGDVAAYGSPNVVHFCIVLFVSAAISAPWQSLPLLGVVLGLTGLGGSAYAALVVRRMVRRSRLQDGYKPVLEDWLWFGTFPLLSYLALIVAAIMLPGSAAPALAPAMFIVGAAMIVLLLIGIRNAWDTVTFIAIDRNASRDKGQDG